MNGGIVTAGDRVICELMKDGNWKVVADEALCSRGESVATGLRELQKCNGTRGVRWGPREKGLCRRSGVCMAVMGVRRGVGLMAVGLGIGRPFRVEVGRLSGLGFGRLPEEVVTVDCLVVVDKSVGPAEEMG